MKSGWQEKKLGEVAYINYGFTEKASIDEVGPKFLRITDIQDGTVQWDGVPYCVINSKDLSKYKLFSGDIVFARTGATTGKSFLVIDPPESVFASYLIRLRIQHESLMPEFVNLFFQTAYYWKTVNDGVAGSAQGGFNATKLGELTIPIPPLPEQQRIVAILDEAFDSIATAKASAEQNLKNARELFDSYLQSVFTQRGEGWVEKRLGELCNKIQDGAHNSPPIQFAESGSDRFMYITSKNIRNNYVDLTNVSYVNVDFHNSIYPRCKPEVGDVLLTKDGANTGNVTINTIDEPFSLLSSVCLIKPNTNKLLASFLKYYIQSPCGLMSIVGKMTGTAIKRIVLKDIKNAIVPVPDIEAQRSIVARLDELSFETQRLEAIYKQKIAALDELKQSLLQKAFAGEL